MLALASDSAVVDDDAPVEAEPPEAGDEPTPAASDEVDELALELDDEDEALDAALAEDEEPAEDDDPTSDMAASVCASTACIACRD